MARLLLVEDDPMILNALTAFLREEGFETETADGQRAALELLSRHSFDLVLLDITLREGNGFDTCRAIKAQSSVPVFFLTASGDESSTVAGLDMGADDYIAKPFRPRELLSRIRSALRRSGADAARLTLGPLTLDTDKGEVYREGGAAGSVCTGIPDAAAFCREPGKAPFPEPPSGGAVGYGGRVC